MYGNGSLKNILGRRKPQAGMQGGPVMRPMPVNGLPTEGPLQPSQPRPVRGLPTTGPLQPSQPKPVQPSRMRNGMTAQQRIARILMGRRGG
jgi:hypothetical protein